MKPTDENITHIKMIIKSIKSRSFVDGAELAGWEAELMYLEAKPKEDKP